MSDDEGEIQVKGDGSLSLPKSAMEKLVKDLLPSSIKCPPETKALLADCCVEFIQMVASEANDLQTRERKKMMSSEHVLVALENLGFSNYIADAKDNLEKHKSGPKRENLAAKLRNSGFTPEELAAQQAALFAKAKQSFSLRASQEVSLQSSTSVAAPIIPQSATEMKADPVGEEIVEEIEGGSISFPPSSNS